MGDRIQQSAAQWNPVKQIDERKQQAAFRQVCIDDIDPFPVQDHRDPARRSDGIEVDDMDSDREGFYQFDQWTVGQYGNDRETPFHKLFHACKKDLLTAPDFRRADCQHDSLHFNISPASFGKAGSRDATIA
jgi:hypothetical protein